MEFRKTWPLTNLHAHGVTPHWRKEEGWEAPEFPRIDLHWHDLRHEYASRLGEQRSARARDIPPAETLT